ncbi:MAG: histidine phosphatase family protein [Pseudomonadota bacterium]|nr:histidine phosphatase family protein [Pseudomonadota bacterium]
MSLIHLVRHGQASFGTEDYDRLSELGHRQSRWLGEHFAERGLRFSRVFCGTLARQRDTATAILSAMGETVEPVVHPGFDEYHAGPIYSAFTMGRSPVEHQLADYKDYWQTFRNAMNHWADTGLADVPETWTEFGARISAGLAAATQGTGREDRILVVSSGGAICRAVADILGAPPATAIELNLQFRNTGICELIAGGGRYRLLSFNHIPHLEQDGRAEAISAA